MGDKLLHRIKESTIIKTLIHLLKQIKPPGFEGMNLYELILFVAGSFKKGNFSIRSAAISFNLILSIFPLLLVILALIPYIPLDGFQMQVLSEIIIATNIGRFNFEETLRGVIRRVYFDHLLRIKQYQYNTNVI